MNSFFVVAPLLLALSVMLSVESAAQSPPSSLPGTGAASAPETASLSIEQAVAEALQSNPDIQAASKRVTLARLKIATARSLDDPMLMIRDWDTPLRKPWDLNQAQAMFSIQQTFPGSSKRALRGSIAADGADAAGDDLQTMRQDVSARVRELCAGLLRNAKEMQLHGQQAEVLKESLASVLSQYTSGQATQADVLRAQMATTRLSEHLLELEQEHDDATAQLNALMGRGPDRTLEITGDFGEVENLPSIEELERVAIENRPELAGLRAIHSGSAHTALLSRLAMKPDLTVAAGYMLMPSGSNFRNAYMAELSMNLPSLNRGRHEGESRQADAAADVAQEELDARTSAVFLEVRQAQIEVQTAQARMNLYRKTLLPQAEATFKASTAAYQNNRGELMNVIDSENLLLDIQTDLDKAAFAAEAGIARVERAIGAPLNAMTRNNAVAGGLSK